MENSKKALSVYFAVVALTGVALALSDQIFSNYFKDAYQVSAFQRGLIELPRELPGIIGMLVIASLSFLGDIRISAIAQLLSAAGLLILGLFTPVFGVMLIFLFINSMGMHLFFPLQDGIGLALIGSENVGKRMGQFKAVGTAFTMLAGIVVFIGFRIGWFSFTTPIKTVFLISAAVLFVIMALLMYMQRLVKTPIHKEIRLRLVFRRKYKYYYILAIMNGVQKQIMFVYAPWVLIEILSKKADTIVALSIAGAFLGIFTLQIIGKCIDRFGIRKMLYAEALSFIFVYLAYGVMTSGFAGGRLATVGAPVALTLAIFILDKISMQFAMVRTVYLRSISHDPSEITQTLSTGISMDHIVTIGCAYLGGVVWMTFGPQYIFYAASALSLVNLAVARLAVIDDTAR